MDEPLPSQRMQFGLRSIFIGVTIASVWTAIQTVLPVGFRFIFEILFATASPALLAATIYYGNGSLRAFAIGAIFPPVLAAFMLLLHSSELVMLGPSIILDNYPLPEGVMYTARASLFWFPFSILLGLCTIGIRLSLRRSDTSLHNDAGG